MISDIFMGFILGGAFTVMLALPCVTLRRISVLGNLSEAELADRLIYLRKNRIIAEKALRQAKDEVADLGDPQ